MYSCCSRKYYGLEYVSLSDVVVDSGEMEVPFVVTFDAVVGGRCAAELLVVVGDTAYHATFEVKGYALLSCQFYCFKDE